MDVNISIKLVGILAIVGLALILSYFSSLSDMNGWAIVFFIFAIVVVVLFLIRGNSGD
jgi:heme/copper-type cytochrome/quinol oxidase subunit 4